MIQLTLKPEPSDFDERVRRPGKVFLRSTPNPNNREWNGHNFWTRCLPQLREKYQNICAYSACWIPTNGTVDHFSPKGIRPDLAYEWENYRLASDRLNNFKGKSTNIIDPISVQPGWFTIDFDSFYVVPGRALSGDLLNLVKSTIDILRLNQDDVQVNFRFDVVKDYAIGLTSMFFLEARYPFIALELQRQGLTNAIKAAFRN